MAFLGEKMRKIVFFLLALLLFTGCEKIGVYKTSKNGKPVPFKKGEVQCVECTMPLETKIHSAQAIMPDGKVYFFDDPGCMAKWLQKQKDTQHIKLWVYTNDTKRYIDAHKAWYKLGDRTPMNYGFGAYEKRVAGSVDFQTFLTMMYRGENMTNPAIRKKILGE